MWKASINKGAHVGQPALSVLFALLSLSIDAIVNKTEKALSKRLRGKPGFAEESPYSPAAVAANAPPQLLTLRRRLSTID